MRQLVRGGKAVPMGGQEAQRVGVELLGSGIPREAGRGGAVLGEGRGDCPDVARDDIRRPAVDAIPIECNFRDAPNSR